MSDNSKKILIFQHVPFEGPGVIASWAERHGYTCEVIRLFDSHTIPDLNSYDSLIIMGGPMSIADVDKYSWMSQEKKAIENYLKLNRPVLGICLGAQMLGEVLGARVFANEFKEIGWFPVRSVENGTKAGTGLLPGEFEAFHWHGETFDIPSGAKRLAESDGCRNQGFLYDKRAAGLQFHLEMTPQVVNGLVESCRDEIVDGKYIQTPRAMWQGHHRYYKANGLMHMILNRLIDPD